MQKIPRIFKTPYQRNTSNMAETYYFSHDYNARNDVKLKCLLKDWKAAGYGLYWILVEMMHESESCLFSLDDLHIMDVATDAGFTTEQFERFVDECVNKYRLFNRHEDNITSDRVIRNKTHRVDLRLKRSQAGRMGGKKRALNQANATVFQANASKSQANAWESQANASSKQANPSKGKEIKESKVKDSIDSYLLGLAPEKQKQWADFNQWLKDNTPRILTMKEPLTPEQYFKLVERFGKIGWVCKKMHNYKPLLSKNISAYLTIINWIERDNKV